MSQFYSDAIFWIEVEKVRPNPYQPRREFDEAKLRDLSESIRQYGVLQPLVVTRHEVYHTDGGLSVEYELIAGERRLRAAKLAGLSQVPVIIRSGEEDDQMKLELAIIENLQREDLNPIDRAQAFERLANEFHFKHTQIAQKIGRSREYVSNTLRLLTLPEEMRQALSGGKISEGHARAMMMLADRPAEQMTLFKEIMYKKLTVREAEAISRKIAQDRIRKKNLPLSPELSEMERQFTESLGTRVQIERKEVGGKLTIDFFSEEDLSTLLEILRNKDGKRDTLLDRFIASQQTSPSVEASTAAPVIEDTPTPAAAEAAVTEETAPEETEAPIDDRSREEKDNEEDLYSIKNFSI
jgi:ParB family chromosome partitioning protein